EPEQGLDGGGGGSLGGQPAGLNLSATLGSEGLDVGTLLRGGPSGGSAGAAARPIGAGGSVGGGDRSGGVLAVGAAGVGGGDLTLVAERGLAVAGQFPCPPGVPLGLVAGVVAGVVRPRGVRRGAGLAGVGLGLFGGHHRLVLLLGPCGLQEPLYPIFPKNATPNRNFLRQLGFRLPGRRWRRCGPYW